MKLGGTTPRRLITTLGSAVGGTYLALTLLLFALQRVLVFPAPSPAVARWTDAVVLDRVVAGNRVFALYLPPPSDGPVVAHFHGNAEQLSRLASTAATFRHAGLGFFAVEYPGYGALADGEASEQNIYTAAEAALDLLESELGVARRRIVLQGRSLGTGVATEMAHRSRGARLILVSPFTSIPDVGARAYPLLPVRWLARDHFDNLAKANSIDVPVLIVHGTIDTITPYDMGQTLAAAFPRAELHTLEGRGHKDVSFDHVQRVLDFAAGH